MENERKVLGYRNLSLYFVVAYTFSWIFWIPQVLASNGFLASSFFVYLVGFIAPFGPLVSAFSITYLKEGSEAVKELLRRGVDYRFGRRWLIPILMLFPLWAGIALLIGVLTNEVIVSLPWLSNPFSLIFNFGISNFVYMFIFAGVAEEFGWRGYALERFQARFSAITSSVLLGLIWGLWHLPTFFIGGSNQQAAGLGPYLLQIVVFSMLFTWLSNNTNGSILVAIVFHAMMDLTFSTIFPVMSIFGPGSLPAISMYFIGLMILISVIVIWGPKRLVHNANRQNSMDSLNKSMFMPSVSIVKQHKFIIYVVFAYLFTSLCCIPTGFVAIGKGWALPTDLFSLNFKDIEQARVFLVFILGVYGPIVAAVTSSLLMGGRPALRQLEVGIKKWRVGLYWFLVVMFLPIVLNLIGSVPAVLMGSRYSPSIPLQYFLLYLGYEFITSGMEEVGWRGYALPHLQSRYTAERSSWILGIIWGVWHFPSIAFLYYAAGPFLANNLFASLISIIGLTFVYTWLYNNTESILMMVIFHGWSNTLGLYMVNAFNNPMAIVLTAALNWILARQVLVRRYGKENLSKKARPAI